MRDLPSLPICVLMINCSVCENVGLLDDGLGRDVTERAFAIQGWLRFGTFRMCPPCQGKEGVVWNKVGVGIPEEKG